MQDKDEWHTIMASDGNGQKKKSRNVSYCDAVISKNFLILKLHHTTDRYRLPRIREWASHRFDTVGHIGELNT